MDHLRSPSSPNLPLPAFRIRIVGRSTFQRVIDLFGIRLAIHYPLFFHTVEFDLNVFSSGFQGYL